MSAAQQTDDPTVMVTCWASLTETTGRREALTWSALAKRLATVEICATRTATPGWSPATFAGDARGLDRLELVHAIGLDLDHGPARDLVVAKLRGRRSIVHSTWHHNAAKGNKPEPASPRWRVLLGLSRPIHAKEYSVLHPALTRDLGLDVDAAAADASRFWFLPSTPADRAAAFESFTTDGNPVDVDEMLEREAIRDEPRRAPPRSAPAASGSSVLERASAYLARMDPAISGSSGHQALWRAALALVRGFDLSDVDALRLLESEYNPRCKPPWSRRELEHKVAGAGASNLARGYLLHDERREWRAPPMPKERQDDEQTNRIDPRRARARTDLGNSERLVERHGFTIRYCPPRRAWLLWDGRRWSWDTRGGIIALAKRTARSIYDEAKNEPDADKAKELAKHAHSSESAARIAAMLDLARSVQRVVVMGEELDADPMLFNVSNGTLDLRTGELRPHRSEDLITKLAPVSFEPGATCETWDRFLRETTGGDDELAAYLRRVAGYCLTGRNDERALFFAHGPPGTGKSTFLDALTSMFGDYAAIATAETWLRQTSTGGNRGDLVALMGARIVLSVEVTKGARWDEALLRRVTGGDVLKYAAKYEAEVSFRATFKILFAANDAPKVRDDDEALWERMRRAPFSYRPARLDPSIRATLTKPGPSRSAILAWAVRGCSEWQRDGLGSCAAVDASTAAYREEMDRFAPFAEACLAFESWDEAWVGKAELREAYREWCQANGVKYPLTPEELGSRLRAAGAIDARAHAGRHVWRRVRLLGNTEKAAAGDVGRRRETPFSETPS